MPVPPFTVLRKPTGAARPRKMAPPSTGALPFRVYEKLNSEGKWEPAAEFAVGDLVRITLHVDKGPTPLPMW